MTSVAEFAAWVGIDWGDEEHAVCLRPAEGGPCERRRLRQRGEELEAWVAELRTRFGGRPVAVCLEQSRGPLLYALMRHDFLVLFPVNPKQLARFRQALCPSGAKDDPGDAELACRLLEQHHSRLRAWRADDETTRALRLLVEARRKWVDQRTALGNQLQQQLKECFPLALELVAGHVYVAWFLRLLERCPSHAELRRLSPRQLTRLLPPLRRVADDPPEDPRVALLRGKQPLITDAAVVEAGRLAVRQLATLLRQLNEAIDVYDRQIAQRMAQHPDAELFRALPGAGEALAPRLVAAFGSDRTRYASAADLQHYSGIAPVTVQSGKSRSVRKRRACPKFLRQTFHEFAAQSRRSSAWAAAYYRMQRAAGMRHHAALRALAFKWIRILYRCWQNRTPYDESRHLARLRQTRSPLLDFLETVPLPS